MIFSKELFILAKWSLGGVFDMHNSLIDWIPCLQFRSLPVHGVSFQLPHGVFGRI